MSEPAVPVAIDRTIEALAREAGFSQAGIAPVPPSEENYPELDQVENWLDHGYAGEMEYLKRRDDEGRLLRSSVRIPFPWARSVIVCAANYQVNEAKSIDAAPEGSELHRPLCMDWLFQLRHGKPGNLAAGNLRASLRAIITRFCSPGSRPWIKL